MEFDTGSRPDPAGSGGSGGGTGVRPPGMSASAGGEFDLSDPVASFVRTVRSLVTAPAAFFRAMPKSGGLINPIAFAVICSLIAALPAAVLVLLFGIISAASGDPSAGGIVGVLVGAVLALILIPIGTVVGLFIGSGLFHLLVLAFVRPSHAGFGATLRVFAYASFANILTFLTFIPLLGILVGLAISIYTVVLSVIGIREAHATTTGRAAVVVLAPVVVLFILGFIISVIVAFAVAGAQ